MPSLEVIQAAADRAEALYRSNRGTDRVVSLSFLDNAAVVGFLPPDHVKRDSKKPFATEVISATNLPGGMPEASRSSTTSEFTATREMPDGVIPQTLAGTAPQTPIFSAKG